MMLRPKSLPLFLSQVCTGGVQHALLLRSDGIMLASSQDRPDAEYFDDEKLVGAICAGMWFNFAEETADSLGKTESELGDGDSSLRGNLRSMIVECEGGRLCAAPVGSLLICLKGDLSVQLGLLKLKTEALAEEFRTVLATDIVNESTVET
uniref:Roadblock/LAMTOR2 domain-containing protein n=2 Tax=Rhodosorus marinus TaxID=101924 RepID=A0A7S3EHQ6_9RHOD|mmetsp:Transcript_33413/g.131784  ORF Transcript_33413/g.131784 Transcript_33413/m.131784 type:complete len:151 (+) Transcript_33413:331-783(+)